MKNNVAVGNSKIGRGVFALKDFYPLEPILTLKGRPYKWGDKIHYSELGANLIQTGFKSYIYPFEPGLFLNHSCNPNSGIFKNRKLIAIKRIGDGEEITFDYSTTMDENFWTLECQCGERDCREKITDFRFLPSDIKSKYLQLNIVQGFIASNYKE